MAGLKINYELERLRVGLFLSRGLLNDAWLDTRLGNDAVREELVEFFVFLEAEVDVSGDDSALFVLFDDHD